jgi:lipopolysaccharide biosynthesis protein
MKRICLFAFYDPDNIVDEYVVEYVKEVSNFADVYCLADCNLDCKELEKLYPYAKKAWAYVHGKYDFG